MNNIKQFDCVKFKNELQENLIKTSGAKTIKEYAHYVNTIAQSSPLHKSPEKVILKIK